MSHYIFDTDCFSLWQRNHPVVVAKVSSILPENINLTIIKVEEIIRGIFHVIRQASQTSQVEKLVLAYRNLWETLEEIKQINVLKFEQDACVIYTELRRQKIRIGSQDLKIASIALAHNYILITRNYRDFCKVPNLIFEDWTIPV